MIGQFFKGHALLEQRAWGQGVFAVIGNDFLIIKNGQVVFALIVQALAHVVEGFGGLRPVGICGE